MTFNPVPLYCACCLESYDMPYDATECPVCLMEGLVAA